MKMSVGKFENIFLSEREDMKRLGNDLGVKIIDQLFDETNLYMERFKHTCNVPIKHSRFPSLCARPLDGKGVCAIHRKLPDGRPRNAVNLRDDQFESYYNNNWTSQKLAVIDSVCVTRNVEDCKECKTRNFCIQHTIGYGPIFDSFRSSMSSSGDFDHNLLDIVGDYVTVECNVSVSFKVEGTDHCGWCTDAENDEIEPYTMRKIIKVRVPLSQKFNDPNFMRTLNYYNSGCTSGGSGMCEGEAFQTYTCVDCFPVRVISIAWD